MKDRTILPAIKRVGMFALVCAVAISSASAGSFGLPTTESSQYLIIVTKVGGKATELDVSNFELGANKAPVPSTDNFLDGGGSGGPTLAGAVPNLPANAAPVFQGVGGHGNIAVIDPEGEFNLQNVGVYADPNIGIRVAAPLSGDGSNINKSSNSFFNDANQFPNTFDTNTQTGNTVNPGAAVQSTRIDASGTPGNVGVTFGFDHSALVAELDLAKATISGFAATNTLDASAGSGQLGTNTTLTGSGGATIGFSQPNSIGGIDATITLQAGLNVIDIFTGGNNDFQLNNLNLVITGPDGSAVIFRLQDDNNMLISNSNVLAGDDGIGMHSILFFTDQDQNDTNFNFQNTIINGAAFWALGAGTIDIDNAQGCTQLIADLVNLQDVRLNGCAFNPAERVPESLPGYLGIVVLSGLIVFHALLGRRECGSKGQNRAFL